MTRTPPKARAATAVTTLAALLLAAACSGGSDSDPTATGDPTPAGTGTPDPWQEGELTPEEVDGRCEEVPPEALELLGMEDPWLPMGDCYWMEEDGDRTFERGLDVGLQAYEADESGTATEAAKAAFESGEAADTAPMLGESWFGELWATVPEIPWLGEEAKARVSVDPVDSTSHRVAQVMVRHRNVILTVQAEGDAHDSEGEARTPPLEDVEAALVSATVGVLSAIGAETDPPAAPDRAAGEYAEALPVCGPLAGHADALVPGHEQTDLTPDAEAGAPGLSGCSWDVETDTSEAHLEVKVSALAPSRLLGLTGSELAAQLHRGWSHDDDARAIDGLGDAAIIERGHVDDSEYRSSLLLVRQDNLLIYVYHGVLAPPSADELDQRAIDVAGDALAAYE
jgi:hypothetical protein